MKNSSVSMERISKNHTRRFEKMARTWMDAREIVDC